MTCEQPRWTGGFREGDRVCMPNGVMATVQGARGAIAEGAYAEGDDGNLYMTAPEPDSYKRLGISTPRPTIYSTTEGA